MSMWNKIVMQTDAGVEQIISRMVPLPNYDVEDVVGYLMDPEKKDSFIESKIIGYSITVKGCGTNDDGDILYDYLVEYEMDNGFVVEESDIDYYIIPGEDSSDDERDPQGPTMIPSEEEVHGSCSLEHGKIVDMSGGTWAEGPCLNTRECGCLDCWSNRYEERRS